MTTVLLPEHAGFRSGLENGQLCFPRCSDCGRFHWYPMTLCPHCRSSRIEWQAVAGRGHVYSFTVVRHAFDEEWRSALPYVVALIEFEDAPGVRLISNLVGIAPEAVRIGLSVVAQFEAKKRVVFRPVNA
jgi:uncharacterized OB-fold protein